MKNSGGGDNTVGDAMQHLLGDDAPTVYRIKLSSGSILRLGLGQWTVVGLAMAALMV